MKNIIESKIVNKIYTIRDQKVMFDFDLAELYGVETKRLNEQVGRNLDRFPEDFMFQLSDAEDEYWKSQIVTSNILKSQNATSKNKLETRGGRRTNPYVFTEQGVAMLSGVLRSKQAVKVNISIMRAFVAMKSFILNSDNLKNKLDIIQLQLEQLKNDHDGKIGKNTKDIRLILEILDKMIEDQDEAKNKKKLGFKTD